MSKLGHVGKTAYREVRKPCVKEVKGKENFTEALPNVIKRSSRQGLKVNIGLKQHGGHR